MVYGTMNLHCCGPYQLYVQLKKYKLTIPLANMQFGIEISNTSFIYSLIILIIFYLFFLFYLFAYLFIYVFIL